MRLLKKQSISDQITEYYSAIKNLDAQKAYYIDYFHKCLDIYQEIYDFNSYHSTLNSEGEALIPPIAYGNLHITTTGAADLQKFKATIEITKIIISSYRVEIDNINKQAGSLIKFLKEEYKLKEP
jgi:hypothetical protein